jgi:hypothetical protein
MTRRISSVFWGLAIATIVLAPTAQATLLMHFDPNDPTRLFEDSTAGTNVGGHDPVDTPYAGEYVKWINSSVAPNFVAQQANAPPLLVAGPTANAPYVFNFDGAQNLLVLGIPLTPPGDIISPLTELDRDTMTVIVAGRPAIGTTGLQTFINFNYAAGAGGPDLVSLEYDSSSQRLIGRAGGGTASAIAMQGQWFVAELKWNGSSGMSLAVNGTTPVTAPSAGVASPNFDRFRLGRTAANTGAFTGQIGDVYVYDSATESTSSLITQLLADYPLVQAPLIRIQRGTGAVTLEYAGAPATILGYSLTSTAGALLPANWTSIADNYDANSGTPPGTVDPNDTWIELTNSAVRTDLSEFEPDGNGATLTNGQIIQLGNAWIRSPIEDVKAQILFADGTAQNVSVFFDGNNNNPLPYGDLDLDGDFDVLDYRNVFTQKYGTNTSAMTGVDKYLNGDFNSDGVTDFTDFLLYRQAYQTAHPGAGTFEWGSVPEPTSAAFVMLALAWCALFGRTHRTPADATRSLVTLATRAAASALLMLICLASQSSAELVAHYDPNVMASLFQDGNNVGGTIPVTAVGQPVRYVNDVRAPVYGHQDAGTIDAFPDIQQAGTAATLASVTGGTVLSFVGTGNLLGFDADNVVTTGTNIGALTGLRTKMDVNISAGVNAATLILTGRANSGATGIGTFLDMRVSSPAVINGAFGMQYNYTTQRLEGLVNGAAVASAPLAPNAFFVASLVWDAATATNNATLKVTAIGSSAMTTATASNTAIDIERYRFGSQATTATVNRLNGLIGDVYLYNDKDDHSSVFSSLVNQYLPALTLEVNKTTGFVMLKNLTGAAIDLSGYQIKSTGAVLNPTNGTGWNSLQDQAYGGTPGNPVWFELGASTSELSEGYIDSFSAIAPGGSINLGKAYNTANPLEDLSFRYHTPQLGLDTSPGYITYVTGGTMPGDFNNDNKVDAADYVVWRKTDNTPAGYAAWRSNFGAGTGSGSGLGSSAVPEPAAFSLLLIVGVFMGAARRRQCVTALASVCVLSITASVASAAVTNDRFYQFGEDAIENGVANNPLGALTYDTQGPTGTYVDLNVSGAATYVSVSDRPGASMTSIGASFDGASGRLSGFSVNAPTNFWDNTTYFPVPPPVQSGPFPGYDLNYENILAHGMQFWAKPNAATQNVLQAVVVDTTQHGVLIGANNNWTLQFNGTSIDSGVPVAYGQWAHVMELGGYSDRTKGFTANGGALFVNGVAVAASNATYAASTANLTVASNTAGTGNFYNGVLDDLKIFLWGNNTGQNNNGAGPNGQDWGTLNLGTDNEWIARKLTELGVTNPGDANLNGTVFGNGTGPAATDDVTFFVEKWQSVREIGVNKVVVGDWVSRQNGDMNYDGRTDLLDAYILHQALIGAGHGAGFDFSLLGGVPEPSTFVLLLSAAVGLFAFRRPPRH